MRLVARSTMVLIAATALIGCVAGPAAGPASPSPSHAVASIATPSPTPSLAKAVVAAFAHDPFRVTAAVDETISAADGTTYRSTSTITIDRHDVLFESTVSVAGHEASSSIAVAGAKAWTRADGGDWQEAHQADLLGWSESVIAYVRPRFDATSFVEEGTKTIDGRTLRRLTTEMPIAHRTPDGSVTRWTAAELLVTTDGTPVRLTMTNAALGLQTAITYTTFGLPVMIVRPEMPPLTGDVLLRETVADQLVRVVRRTDGRLCAEVETTGPDVRGCPEPGSQWWFAGEVADGWSVVLLVTGDKFPFGELDRMHLTTTTDYAWDLNARAGGRVLYAGVRGELDLVTIWNAEGEAFWRTWPPYEVYR